VLPPAHRPIVARLFCGLLGASSSPSVEVCAPRGAGCFPVARAGEVVL
jgi:hypothetical protein